MDVKQFKCSAAVAEELHFGHAAQCMKMLPSALGRQIKLVEERLGTRSLVRSTRHVALTPAGAVLLRDARAILDQVAWAEANVRRLSRQSGSALRIGAIDSAAVGLLPDVFRKFRGASSGRRDASDRMRVRAAIAAFVGGTPRHRLSAPARGA